MDEQAVFLRNAMEAHGGPVYRLALCRLQNTADAEDVYQDVFLRLLREGARDWEGVAPSNGAEPVRGCSAVPAAAAGAVAG